MFSFVIYIKHKNQRNCVLKQSNSLLSNNSSNTDLFMSWVVDGQGQTLFPEILCHSSFTSPTPGHLSQTRMGR